MRTHYDTLRVPRTASQEEIKSAFRTLAKIYHPDATPGMDGSRFRQICEAYKTLSHPFKRRSYDRELRESERESCPTYSTFALQMST